MLVSQVRQCSAADSLQPKRLKHRLGKNGVSSKGVPGLRSLHFTRAIDRDAIPPSSEQGGSMKRSFGRVKRSFGSLIILPPSSAKVHRLHYTRTAVRVVIAAGLALVFGILTAS